MKLTQTKLIDLRPSIEPLIRLRLARPTSSAFEKTRSYFENDLFNDTALRELQELNRVETKCLTDFTFTTMELTHEGILIATNANFLLFGRKSFKNEKFRRLKIDSNAHVEVLHALHGFDDDIVMAALSDGSIKSFCYDRSAQTTDNLIASDLEEPSISSGSSLPSVVTATTINAGHSFASTGNSGGILVATMNHNAALGQANVGKSCTIQSIVQDERKLYEEMQALNNLDTNEYKTLNAIENNQRVQQLSNFSNFVNDQVVLNKSPNYFVKSQTKLVQLIKSKKLVVLHRNRLHIYDLTTNDVHEFGDASNDSFNGVATTVGDNDTDYLVSLTSFCYSVRVTAEMSFCRFWPMPTMA